jgi:cell division protein FtsL
MMRFINICVIVALVSAAAYVYKIKFEATKQAERVVKLQGEIRREHDGIATLRAEWAKLDNPVRIQELANRHLPLKPVDARQFDRFETLPERPVPLVPPGIDDPIGFLVEKPEFAIVDILSGNFPTGSVPPRAAAPAGSKTVNAKTANTKTANTNNKKR